MSTISDFLDMGGYAAYVWPAYGVALGVMGGLAVDGWLRLARRRRRLAELEEARGERR